MRYDFLIGNYVKEDTDGIFHFYLEEGEEGVALHRVGAIGGLENPAYFVYHPTLPVLYTSCEREGTGAVAALQMRDDAPPTLINQMEGGGDGTCHVAVDPKGEYLFASHYRSGTLSVFALREDGGIRELTDVVRHTGHGVHPERQPVAHVHFAKYDQDRLLVCDLGEDKVYRYTLDRETGKLRDEDGAIRLPDGTGPRHLTLCAAHPELLYVTTEMSAEVYVVRRDTGEILQSHSLIPEGTDKASLPIIEVEAYSAGIKCDEAHGEILVSVRGLDAVVSFTIGADGLLTPKAVSPTGGRIPRDFEIFGPYLVVCNQTSGQIAILKRAEDGHYARTGVTAETPCPVCVIAHR